MVHVKFARIALGLAAATALSGCISFGGKPPAQLLTLSAAQKVAPGALRRGSEAGSITIADPDAPKSLDTVRIPVRVNATSIAYLTDTQWADTPRHLFQKLLSETVAATSNKIVLDPGQYSEGPGQRLMGDIVEFGIDAQSNSAVVTFDAILNGDGGTAVAKQRFTASVPVGGKIEAATVGAPLNAAANKVATDVAAWLAAAGN